MQMRVLFCVVAVCLFSSALQGLADAVTQEQAVIRAREFCEQVGWKPIGEPEVSIPEFGYRNKGLWEIRFRQDVGGISHDILVDVNRANGQVYGGLNFCLAHQLNKSTPVEISQTTANELATKYLKSAGVSLEGATLDRNRAWLSGLGRREWEVRYARRYKGYTFHMNDGIKVTLHPTDGSLVSFGYFNVSPLPESARVLVKRDAAISIARAYAEEHLNGKRMQIDGFGFARLAIVQPNDYYEKMDLEWEPTSSRLAWVVELTWDKHHIAQVWVDSENSTILGGVTCR